MTNVWDDQSLIAKLSFSGYRIVFHDIGTGLTNKYDYTTTDLVESDWKKSYNDFDPNANLPILQSISFPTAAQFGMLLFADMTNFVMIQVEDLEDNILWKPAK